MNYNYKAMTADGQITKGNMEALHIMDLDAKLQRQGLDLINAREKKEAKLRFNGKKKQRYELINFCFYLEQLVSAGVPILEALKDLRDSMDNGYFQDIVSTLIEKIEAGESFSKALSNFPKTFSKDFINLIIAGEESGELERVLRDINESLKWNDELIAQTKKIMIYPLVVGGVIFSVVLFLMVYLVPQLIDFISSMEGELPIHTKALISVSDFFVDYWLWVSMAPFVFIVFVRLMYQYDSSIRIYLDKLNLHIPIIGPIKSKMILAKFANYFSLQYASGITVLRSIETCGKIVGNAHVENVLHDAHEMIVAGKTIHEALDSTGMFPPLVVRMIKVGEKTGELDKSLDNVSYFYRREIDEAVGSLQEAIQPLLTVVMGTIIAWIMLSVMGPIYDLMTTINV